MLARTLGFLRSVARNRRGQAGLPRFLTYAVTFACNARCIMCESWKMPSRGELSTAEVTGVFDQLPRLDAVRLTGGEPFLRQDLPEIAQLVQSRLRPLLLHVTTNGFLTERIVRFCQERDQRVLLQMLISVDGVGEKHNQVRGRASAWTRVMETITALAPHQKALNVRLAVNQTIVDDEGVEHYRQLREILQPQRVANHAVMAYESSATYSVDRSIDVAPKAIGELSPFGDISAQSLQQLLQATDSDLQHLPWHERLAKRYYWQGVGNRRFAHRGAPNPRCVALSSHLRILPNGDIPTCQFNGQTLGNLREKEFQDIWWSKQAARQRDWVRRCPGCWAECEVLPNAIYSLDLFRAAFARLPVPPQRPSQNIHQSFAR